MDKLTKSERLNYLLHQMGIWNYYDVINHLPRRYDNFTLSDSFNLIDKQKVVLFGEVTSIPKLNRGKKVQSVIFDFVDSNRRYYRVIAFNRPYLIKTIEFEEKYTLIGTYDKRKNEIDLINLVKGEIEKDKTIRPIYSLPKDYPNHLFYNLVKKSLKELEGKIYSYVPYTYMNKYKLIDKEKALNYIHSPKNFEEIRQALRYLKYEEALRFSLKNQMIRNDNRTLKKYKKEPIDLSLCEDFISSLPFILSEDQLKASEEIIEDMNNDSLMYRLLQGDVGSGKTVVAFLALYANYKRGDQGALMAPTDSLARQHYHNALELFKNTKVRIALLTGNSKKDNIYRDIEDGYIDIVIGTHALFSKGVNYSSLGLVIIDEQHRFGVNQRLALANKGSNADILMMSATPIPRSLALTLYGDLDISTLTSFPNKKKDIKTMILDSNSEKIFSYVDKCLEEHRQVYIVAPLIDYREDERYSVEQLFARYLVRYHERVGLLHGKLKAEEKEMALEKFYSNEVPILVTTQVIEVGIDVKEAGLMVIYDASNFGLASLHQLRGRIGRDGNKAICILTHDDESEEDKVERLKILVNSFDGFYIAEEDMKLRGPGELVGVKQSGLPNFNYLNVIDDMKIFVVARDDAKYILEHEEMNKGFSFVINQTKKEIEFDNKNNNN